MGLKQVFAGGRAHPLFLFWFKLFDQIRFEFKFPFLNLEFRKIGLMAMAFHTLRLYEFRHFFVLEPEPDGGGTTLDSDGEEAPSYNGTAMPEGACRSALVFQRDSGSPMIKELRLHETDHPFKRVCGIMGTVKLLSGYVQIILVMCLRHSMSVVYS